MSNTRDQFRSPTSVVAAASLRHQRELKCLCRTIQRRSARGQQIAPCAPPLAPLTVVDVSVSRKLTTCVCKSQRNSTSCTTHAHSHEHTRRVLFVRTLACTHKGFIPYHVVQQLQLNYAHTAAAANSCCHKYFIHRFDILIHVRRGFECIIYDIIG